MPAKAEFVHFNRDTASKLEKFPKVVDSVLNEYGIDLYNKVFMCAKKVYTALGDCYRDEIYTQALAMEIRDLGYSVETDVESDVIYRGSVIGKVRSNLIARGEESFIIDVKRQDVYRGVMQLIGCMRSTNIDIGYVIGFKKNEVNVRCIFNDSPVYLYDGKVIQEMTRT